MLVSHRTFGISDRDALTPEPIFRSLVDEPWSLRQFADASFEEAAIAAAIVTEGRGGQPEALCIHHHRDGRLNFKALVASMARLLTQQMDCTDEEREACYEHLAAHYHELQVEPPEPGAMDEDRAYELALEGRLAHIDDDGSAWMFAEAVEHDGQILPGFVSIDDERNLKLCIRPEFGPHADHRSWGSRRRLNAIANRNSYDDLAFRTMEGNRRLGRQ